MHPELINLMARNLRSYLDDQSHGLRLHQVDALSQVRKFLNMSVGAPLFVDDPELLYHRKKGNFFEVLSATGTGKTRMFGTMAKAMDVPTLILTPRNVLNNQTRDEFCEEIGISASDIAVYDSKQKISERRRALHPERPPKFLIATYQSLPSLMRNGVQLNNAESGGYRPLIILDEVHTAQGPQISRLIRQLMQTNLVAGFTATDAGAKDKLFYHQEPIFNLPIVKAIKDGLLCEGVRTGVLDVQIDADWVKNFSRVRPGEDYREEDVHQFALNPSVVEGAIKFHLNCNDEQLGRLHKYPTIFYTQGIDAAEKGAERFNELAESMGLSARADFISGEMKADVRDAKLKAFKEGKIQALWNDRVLEMGFNDKNATIAYSLKPSLFSHVVEQQLGRVTRKEDAEYFARFGRNKHALTINVRGPGMTPFLFGEVLNGSPAVYATNTSTPAPTPPGPPVDKTWPDDVEVHIGYDDVANVLAESGKKHEPLPEKGTYWKTIGQMASIIQVAANNAGLHELWNRMEELYLETGKAVIDDHQVECEYRRSGTHSPFCLAATEADWLKIQLGKMTVDDPGWNWKTKTEFIDSFRWSPDKKLIEHPYFDELWKQIEAAYRAKPTEPVVIKGHTVKCGLIMRHNQRTFCLHRDEKDWFADQIRAAIREKNSNWLTKPEAASRVSISPDDQFFNEIWDRVIKGYQEKVSPENLCPEIELDGEKFKAGMRCLKGGEEVFCVHKEARTRQIGDKHYYGWLWKERQKDPRLDYKPWFNGFTPFEHIRMGVKDKNDPVLRKAWEILESKSSKNTYKVNIDGHDVKCAYITPRTVTYFCLHPDDREWFISFVKKLKEAGIDGAGTSPSAGWAEGRIEPRPIAPDAPNITDRPGNELK